MPFDVLASGWGDAVGATLDRIHLAIPGGTAASALKTGGMASSLATLLSEGSLSELDRMAGTESGADPTDAGPIDAPAAACRAAAATVQASPEYARARCADVSEVDLVAATARAVAATAAATLLAGYVGVDVGSGLERWATGVLVPHRTRVMQESFLGPADILRYLADGEPVRRFVAGTLREAAARGGPVVAMGNSLGGIILFDALAADDAPRPDLLVTVGSQAPL